MATVFNPSNDAEAILGKLRGELRRQTQSVFEEEAPFLLASIRSHEETAERLKLKLAERKPLDRLTARLRIKQHRVNALVMDFLEKKIELDRELHRFLSGLVRQLRESSKYTADLSARLIEVENRIADLERGSRTSVQLPGDAAGKSECAS